MTSVEQWLLKNGTTVTLAPWTHLSCSTTFYEPIPYWHRPSGTIFTWIPGFLHGSSPGDFIWLVNLKWGANNEGVVFPAWLRPASMRPNRPVLTTPSRNALVISSYVRRETERRVDHCPERIRVFLRRTFPGVQILWWGGFLFPRKLHPMCKN